MRCVLVIHCCIANYLNTLWLNFALDTVDYKFRKGSGGFN